MAISADRIMAAALGFSILVHLAGAGLAEFLSSAQRVASQSAPQQSFQVTIEQIESLSPDVPDTPREPEPARQPEAETVQEPEKKEIQKLVARAKPERVSKPVNKPRARPKPEVRKTSKPVQRKKIAASNPNLAKVKTVAAAALAESQKLDYFSLLQAHIESRKYYPRRARKLGVEGNVAVSFLLHEKGEASDVRSSGGHRLLNQAAIKSIREAMPLPAPPAGLKLPLTVSFTIEYDLRR